jgi:hypothetical protein
MKITTPKRQVFLQALVCRAYHDSLFIGRIAPGAMVFMPAAAPNIAPYKNLKRKD